MPCERIKDDGIELYRATPPPAEIGWVRDKALSGHDLEIVGEGAPTSC
jgi:hypothetical protein